MTMAKLRSLLLLLLLLLAPLISAQLGLNEENDKQLLGRSREFLDQRFRLAKAQQERIVDCSEACPHRTRGPVCGTNGRTYRNLCELDVDVCRRVKVALKHDGECSLQEKCMDERAAREEEVASGQSVYVPNCLTDGSYAPIQCHNFTKHCWCSRLDGKPIPETIQYNSVPVCPDRSHQGLSQSQSPTERCMGKARRTFITNLAQHIVQEYTRERRNSRATGRKQTKQAVKWKYARLDRNGDGYLHRREYKRLRKTVRKFMRPRKCAKAFPRFCDVDGDRKLTEREVLLCFVRQNGRKRNEGSRCTNPPCTNRTTTTPRPSIPSCERNRQWGLEAAAAAATTTTTTTTNTTDLYPVLACQPNGRYEPVQCLKGICLCVDELTGNSLDGTEDRTGRPDCTRPLPHARVWTGCTKERKKKFMQDLKKFLISKTTGTRSLAHPSSDQSLEHFAAQNHFQALDTDANGYIEGRERQLIKRHFRSTRGLRRCGKRLAQYCDVNHDNRVALDEWTACVTMDRPLTGNSSPGTSGRRIEENPILRYLVSDEGEAGHNPRE